MDKSSPRSVRSSIAARASRGAKALISLAAVAAVVVPAADAHKASSRPVRPLDTASIARPSNPGELLKVLQTLTRRAAGRGEEFWTEGRVLLKSQELSDLKTGYKMFRKYAKPYCDSWHNAYIRAYGSDRAVQDWRSDSRWYPSSYAAAAYRICAAAAYRPIVLNSLLG